MKFAEASFEGGHLCSPRLDYELAFVGPLDRILPAIHRPHCRENIDACSESLLDELRCQLLGFAVCGERREDEDEIRQFRKPVVRKPVSP